MEPRVFVNYREHYLTKHIIQPEIDFLHSRVLTSVFMRNYFNPTHITDLRTRIFKAIKEIEEANDL